MSSLVSAQLLKTWEKQGKAEFLKEFKHLVKSVNDTSPTFSENGVVRSIYDVIASGAKGLLKKEWIVATLAEIHTYHPDMPNTILDVINLLDSQTTSGENATEERNNLAYIVKECEKLFSDKLLKERLEIDSLQEMKVLNNRNFYTKFIKVKTKLYYKQRKFNLFREESEGYAKLITELNQEDSSVNAMYSLETIKSLIGCFNLDPNRVLDVILDSFECHPHKTSFFVPLLKAYMPDKKILSEVLGFKFNFFQSGSEVTPKSLYTLTAVMLQHDIIGVDDIYPWLVPDDVSIKKDWEKKIKDAKEYVRRLNVVSLQEAGKEIIEEKEDEQAKYEANQKFGLCEALLKIGNWSSASYLIEKLPKFCMMEQPPIAIAQCKLLHSLIEPLYKNHTTLGPKLIRKTVPPPESPLAPKPVETFLDLRTDVIPMFLTLGPSLHFDPVLLCKLLRVLKAALAAAGVKEHQPPTASDSLYYDTISLLDVVVLPTLSYLEANCCVSEEIWNIVKMYPYQIRYALYSRWKNETFLNHAKLIRIRGEAQKRSKTIMKRVSKETVKQVGRLIGKLTHYCPGYFFDYVLGLIQTYDNLIGPVVDSLKFLSSMSYDVLGQCLIESLASADRTRLKHDHMSISLWLQSLATFCGAIFKKYTIELTGLLQYLANELKMEKSLDLLIMNEIVQKMAGIETIEEMTNEQLEAMAGGDLLKGEGGYFSQVRNTKKSSQRLKEALAQDNLAVSLCLLMAQQRYCVIYKETEKSHLKLVGKLYDQCQDTLVQYGTFLGSTLSMDEYVTRLPSIHSLLSEYHIHTDVAFFLARPMFTHAINLKYDSLRKADPNCKKLSTVQKQQKYCEAVTEVMSPIAQSVRPLHMAKIWEDISPQFLVTFWSLTMYDLFVPVNAYQREINKIKQTSLSLENSKDLVPSKLKKEQEKHLVLVEKLQDERKKQQEHVERVMARLKEEKDSWFPTRSPKSTKNETITQFLQLCLFPRCVFTMVDALYCSKFVHTLHILRTNNFSTLLCFDRLFCDITYTVTSCTENEANRYGNFLCAILEIVMRWHSAQEIFEKECATFPGFITKFRVSNQFSDSSDHLGYENYRHVCHKWHYKITKAMLVCLESKDYVQTRNALIVLIKILPHYPVIPKLSQFLEKRIEKVKEDEKSRRQDLFTLATSYSGQLKAKAPQLIKESDFHQVVEVKPAKTEPAETAPGDSTTSGTSNSQAPSSSVKVNGESNSDKDVVIVSSSSSGKERRTLNRAADVQPILTVPSSNNTSGSKERSREEALKEIKAEKMLKKEEKREDSERRVREKKAADERSSPSWESSNREESSRQSSMQFSKDDLSITRKYHDSNHYYTGSSSQPQVVDERELSSISNSSGGSLHRHSPEPDRDLKRRKVEGSSSSKSYKVEEQPKHIESLITLEKKERRDKSSKKTSKSSDGGDSARKPDKRDRKSRKRGQADEIIVLTDQQKRRKDDTKGSSKMNSHQNGEPIEVIGDKRFVNDKYESDRSRDRDRDSKSKHTRRSSESKRRI
ncbi:THO complex subunit 2 isoform X2 [Bemisia tabaci]|uniref:THO complex subunit 2 isoform X2 n=1 Tax=Bemisia tabaci TaxID=7038 RepID=UPI003B281258